MPMKIQAVSESRFIVLPISASGAARRRTSCAAGGPGAASSASCGRPSRRPRWIGVPTWPSMVRYTLSSGPREMTRITLVSGTSTGRLVSMCGQMGVRQMAGTDGKDDRAAGGERIGRGAGGRGDDQAVGLVGADELLVHVGVQIDHAGDGGLGEHGVVERVVSWPPPRRRAPLRRSAACAWRCDARRAGRAPVRDRARRR